MSTKTRPPKIKRDKAAMQRLIDFALGKAYCPCCCENLECLEGCTIETDCPGMYKEMVAARRALTGL